MIMLLIAVSCSSCAPARTDATPAPRATPVSPRSDMPQVIVSAAACAPGVTVASGNLMTSGGIAEHRRLTPMKGPNGAELEIAAATGGDGHVLALQPDGTVLAWGTNDRGQTGTEEAGSAVAQVDSPQQVVAPDGAVGYLDEVVQVSADSAVSMARRHDGTVVVWGDNNAGQHGRTASGELHLPTTVLAENGTSPLTGVTDIAADGRTLFAVADSHVLAWAANSKGQLGDGTVVDRPAPRFVAGIDGEGTLSDVVDVAAGGQHGIALLSDGRVVTWGSNERGQLGDGTLNSRPVPGVVNVAPDKPLTNAVAVAASELNSYALLESGSVLAWGNGEGGQLGNGHRDPYAVYPTPVQGSEELNAVCIAPGEAFVAVLRDNGTVVTWGSGGRGQLAAGEERGRLGPEDALAKGGTPVEHVQTVGAGERELLVTINAQ